ncbi:MAG: tetratricopeptide repeat protein [Spirochaetes bacterium]|nr:MAG: tetratricopeptide repeat protein [Spirochaetota bacterium]
MSPLPASFPVFIVPPLLSLLVGLTLAGVAVFRGAFRRENVLFALVCVWWTMLSPMFILHHFIADEGLMLALERGAHFLFVFVLPVNLLFYHKVLGIRRPALEAAAFAVSMAVMISTPTELYIRGLYRYPWGTIAVGGVAFQVFGALGIAALVYGIAICVQRLRAERNPVARTKVFFLLFSLNLIALLNLLNIPAMLGYDLYPAGNFMFVPLLIMAYGVLRYRLLDVRSILHLTIIWVVTSWAIVLPNALVFALVWPLVAAAHPAWVFLLVAATFFLNLLYYRRIQPVINRVFNRQRQNLRAIEIRFVEDMAFLRGLTEWMSGFEDVLKNAIGCGHADVYLRPVASRGFVNVRGGGIELPGVIGEWFTGANHIVMKDMVETNPYYAAVKDAFLDLFGGASAVCAVPLVQEHTLIGIALLGEKLNLKPFSIDEVRFMNGVRSAATIALANSIMYQDLNDMKENLARMVDERTAELRTKNFQMTFELKVAKDVQKLILSPALPDDARVRAAARVLPFMEVSGDFYDVVRLADSRVAAAVVDVSGHGLPSALLTSMIKTDLENRLEKPGATTGQVCTLLNANLAPTLIETGFYFTMFLAIIDIEGGVVEYTSCGHPPAVIAGAGGAARAITTDGFPIGAMPGAVYRSNHATLTEGDRLVLYTDGLTEARGEDGGFFGESRLTGAIEETGDLPVKDQLNLLLRMVETHLGGGSARDDITLLIIETGDPARPRRKESDMDRAKALFRDKGYKEARIIVEETGLAAMDAPDRHFAARVYLACGDIEHALYCVTRALELDGESREYLYFRGMTLYRLGRRDEAREAFAEIFERDPGYKNVAELVEKLSDGA